MKFAFIAAKMAEFPITVLCRALEVSRAGFYASVQRRIRLVNPVREGGPVGWEDSARAKGNARGVGEAGGAVGGQRAEREGVRGGDGAEREHAGALALEARQGGGGDARAAGPAFLEIVRPPEPAPVDAGPLERLEVVLRSGLRVLVPVRFDGDALRWLVDALEVR